MNIPSVPPIGNGHVAGPPTAARPEFGQGTPVQAEERQPGLLRRGLAPALAALALTGLAAGAVAYGAGEGNQPDRPQNASFDLNGRDTTTTTEAGSQTDDNEKAADVDCEVFPNGPFEASRDEVKLLPTDLHWQPARGKRLQTTQDVLDFFISDRGDATACRSAATAGVLLYAAAVIDGMGSLDARGLPTHISIQGMVDHIQKLSPEKQSQVIAAIEGMLNKVALNESEIGGIWNKAGSQVIKDADGTEKAVKVLMSRVDLNGDPVKVGTVFVISWEGPNGDDLSTSAGANYQILIDQAGEIYFPESLFPTTSETTTTTTSTTTTTAPEGNSGRKKPTKPKKIPNKNGQQDTEGTAGPNGDNPEAGPEGVTPSPANGTGPGNGGGNPGTTVKPPTTPTSPPTTGYKGPVVTIPGAPS